MTSDEARNQLAKNLAAADTSMSADYMPYDRAVGVLLSDVSLLMTALEADEEFRSDCDCGSDSDLIEVRWVMPWQEVKE